MSELGQQLRVDSVRSSSAANSGHPTSSMSAADLMAVLMEKHLQLDYQNPENPNNDHIIFSKGHASPLFFSMLKAGGAITDDELLTFRKFGSKLEELGISYDDVTDTLEREGVDKFADSFKELLEGVSKKRDALVAA